MSVPKDLLLTIPFFSQMLSTSSSFRESIENKVALPEDDAELWRKALEFLQTGKFFPYFTPSQPGQSLPPRLDIPLLVANEQGSLLVWDGSDDRCGFEILSEETSESFEDLVLLLRLAEEHLWPELMNACVQKIALFPVSRRGFSMLLRLGVNVFQYCWDFEIDDRDRADGITPLQIWHRQMGGPLPDSPEDWSPSPIEEARVNLYQLINDTHFKVGMATWNVAPWVYQEE
ncbi:hypothetical protein MMC30_004365 [Trapelia coarctata]|nr:hypothetical protein [Trapelia coarctata]